MRKVTISRDEDLVRRAKVEAARQDMRLARYIANLVTRAIRPEGARKKHSPKYQKAMESFLARGPYIKRKPGTPFLKREELYDRPLLRRQERLAPRDEPGGRAEERGSD